MSVEYQFGELVLTGHELVHKTHTYFVSVSLLPIFHCRWQQLRNEDDSFRILLSVETNGF